MVRRARIALPLVLLALAARASGDEPKAPTPTAANATAAKDAAASSNEIEARLRALEAANAQLMSEVKALRDDHDSLASRFARLLSKVNGLLGGYLDFGFFSVSPFEPGGNGSGIRALSDYGPDVQARFDAMGVPLKWVYLGDPLSTAVNSRNEPADTTISRAVTFNPIHNGGTASFIVNSLTLSLLANVGEDLSVNATFDLVPRSRNVSVSSKSDPSSQFLGDFIDVRRAYAEYHVPTDRFDLRLYAGKFDSVLGIEYRAFESPDRIGVTPSLICRYTCGDPVGLKARARFANDLFVIAIAVTNGTSFMEEFPFYDEIDTNWFKTVSGRISTRLPVGAGLEIGFSGAFGAQDFQPRSDVFQWHYGVDLHLEVRDLDLRAEFVQGEAPGSPTDEEQPDESKQCADAACLYYKGAYGQLAYRVFNWLTPYVRVDYRDAIHHYGTSFLYYSDLMRVTGGFRLELGESAIVKAEYTWNRELGALPQIPNDVLTTSLVVKF